MTNQTQPKLPFVLLHDEADKTIFNAVNAAHNAGVPFCFLEGILTNVLHQVREQATNERRNAAMFYEKQMEEYNKKCKEGEEKEAEEKEAESEVDKE